MNSKQGSTQADQREKAKWAIRNSVESMREGGRFALSVSKLLEAFANEDVSAEVMTPMVIDGLAIGLQMLSYQLAASADSAERLTGEGAQ
ncbi:hypothetical protein [Pseudomonas veronii]